MRRRCTSYKMAEELKEKGDAFIKEMRYQEALDCYTAALERDSSSHAILSNRSLAFFKLGKFQEAVDDANKCIDTAPEFGRGYLRKATALSSLGVHTDAMLAAAEGYKRRQSDTVCTQCVSQWLLANQAVHHELVNQASKSFGIPTGVLILSENVYKILHKVTVTRVSTAGMTQKLMTSYLLDVVKEMDSLLSKFGHINPSSMSDWICSLSLANAVDPQTDSIPKVAADQIVQNGSEFSKSLMASIDSILHPIVCPLVALCVIIINNRSYTLDCSCSGHHERQAICESLLPLFKSGILNSEPYIVHHLCTFVGLLGSFCGRRTPLTSENIQQMGTYSQQMRMVLAKLTPKAWEYHELKETCLGCLAIAEQDAEVIRQGCGDLYVTAGVEAMAKAQFAGSSPPAIVSSVEQYMQEVRSKRPELFTVDDAEYLLYGAYALADMGQNQRAMEAFEMGQFLFIQIFIMWMALGVWSLDEMGSIIAGPRNIILEVAAKLAPVNSELFVNAIIQWKSLYSEFNSLLIRIGLRSTYRKTYSDVLTLQKEGKATNQQAISQIAMKHREEEDKLVRSCGPKTLHILFRECYQPIQKLIEKDEVVVEYCYLCASEPSSDDVHKDKLGIMCGIVVIKPEGKPVTLVIDFSNFGSVVIQWLKQMNSLSGVKFSEEAKGISHQLCDILFPPEVREIIEDVNVKRVFLCPDLVMTVLPLDLILFPDDEMLYQKCAVTLLSSSREILRGGGGALLEDEIAQLGLSFEANKEIPDNPLATENPITASRNNRCIIFANPNFDLEAPQQGTASVAHILEDILGVFHISTPVTQIEPLPISEEEANGIEHLLSASKESPLQAEKVTGDKATVKAALSVQSPFLLHFATHTFSTNKHQKQQLFGGNFWASTNSGLVLAGANTFSSGKYSRMSEDAGTGRLTGLAVCGMNLRNTRLVYLSACSSSAGHPISGESPITLAHAFRAAGAQSVIATLWPVTDEASSKFSSLFYSTLCKRGVHPSEALVAAKNSMQQDPEFSHWTHWAPYVCLGFDFPLFVQ